MVFISYSYFSYISFYEDTDYIFRLKTGTNKRPQDTKEARAMALLLNREVLGMYLYN